MLGVAAKPGARNVPRLRMWWWRTSRGSGEGRVVSDRSRTRQRRVAHRIKERTGFHVLTVEAANSTDEPIADVLHLGDVLEHLTEMENQLPRILRLIRPGGLLLAQGPLEGNFNFFAACCGLSRRLRPWHRTAMAPYHVFMATSNGQRLLFQRFGLSELEYSLNEVAWPAPSKVTIGDIARPKHTILFGLRRMSMGLSTLNPRKWGNRYFYAGAWQGSSRTG